MHDTSGNRVGVERPEPVLHTRDDEDLQTADHDPQLLVLVTVRRNNPAGLELEQGLHRAFTEERPARDTRGELEALDVRQVDELRLHYRPSRSSIVSLRRHFGEALTCSSR